MKAIRISYDSGEYFVSAKSGSNFKSDSVYHDINKAFNRAFALLEGDAKQVESQRLVARVRELEDQRDGLEAQRDDLNRLCAFNETTMGRILEQNAKLLAALEKALATQAYRRGHGPDWWEDGHTLVELLKGSQS